MQDGEMILTSPHFKEISLSLVVVMLMAAMMFIAPDYPELLLLFALLPLLMVLFYRKPFILCLLFIIFSFFRIHEAYMSLEPLRIPSLLAASSLGILAWKIFLERAIKPYWRVEFNSFFAFFILVTLGCLTAASREMAFAYWNGTYVKIAIMVVAIAWLARKPEDFAMASKMFVLAGIAIGYVAIYNKINEIGLVEGTRVTIARDIKSVLGDPNDLSLVLLFPLSFAMTMLVIKTNFLNRLLGFVGSGVIFWAIICTQSRGGLLGFLTVSGIIGSRVIKSKTVLLTIGAIAAVMLLALAGISKRSSGGAGEDGIDESSMGRIYAWQAATNMANTKPLTGVGLDNFVVNYFAYSPHWDGKNHAVHSTWFGVFGETGYPGLIAFLVMTVTIARSIYKTDKKLNALNAPMATRSSSLALLAGFAGFCVSATFLTQGFTWPIYILLALTIALGKYAINTSPQ
jgi:putative inorganic carbon (hco3(-)) transporter